MPSGSFVLALGKTPPASPPKRPAGRGDTSAPAAPLQLGGLASPERVSGATPPRRDRRQVPTPAEEDARQLHRELLTLQSQATGQTNRIKGLLASCGLAIEIDRHFPKKLKELRQWDGTPLPEALRQRLLREFERLQLANR